MALALKNLPPHWLLAPTINKQPVGFEWQKHPFTPESLFEQLDTFGQVQVKSKLKSLNTITPTGFAIICGQNSLEYLIAIDCDGESVHKAIPTLPPTVAFTSGRPGRAQYLFKITSSDKLKSRKLTTKAREKLELRGAGHASVLPPSVHPLTGSYHWLSGCNPQEIEVATAPDWIISKMLMPTPLPERLKNAPQVIYESRNQDSEEKRALGLLQKIPSTFADDYHSWITIGMALKNLNPSLLPVWNQWSQQSSKYKPSECEIKWKSFRDIQIRSSVAILYYFANKY